MTHEHHATMRADGFDRSHCYALLDEIEQELGEHLRRTVGDAAPSWLHGDDGWAPLGEYGVRVRRVREAVDGADELALRNLAQKLGQLDLAQIWPLLREVCHDIALYVGGAAVTGGAIGGGLGFFFGGVGAVPGALAGTAAGVEVGGMLLGFLGLKSLIEYMLDSVPRAADAYRRGLKHAWGHVPQYDVMAGGVTLAAGDFDDHGVFAARQDIAEGHEILVMALLTAIVAYLSRGKGNLPALLAEVRRSPRLGPRMAGWLEQNAERLRKHPLLQNARNGKDSSADGARDSKGGPRADPGQPAKAKSTERKGVFGEAKADEFMQKNGFEKLNKGGKLTEIDDAPHGHGIDGIWRNSHPPPDFVITEAKYGAGSMGATRDGKQMSDDWLMGTKTRFSRLKNAISENDAIQIEDSRRMGRVEKWLLRVDESGTVSKRRLDEAGNVRGGK